MKPKQFHERYSSIFQDASVVAAYRYRPEYPNETFAILSSLIPPSAAQTIVLDAGCGTGFIARPLGGYVDHIDAVDISEQMIAVAKTLPGGERPNITWIAAPIETAPLSGPYALIVAAESLHWMDWERVLPRFADLLIPHGLLALVEILHAPNPWEQQAAPAFRRYSLNKDFVPYNLMTVTEELRRRGLFRLEGRRETAPVTFRQPLDSYIESFHARNGLSRDRMGQEIAARFDAELRAVVEPFCLQGAVELQISARVLWGRPMRAKMV